ncbi:unnamed protein product, partial [Prorocentrum cordatum]
EAARPCSAAWADMPSCDAECVLLAGLLRRAPPRSGACARRDRGPAPRARGGPRHRLAGRRGPAPRRRGAQQPAARRALGARRAPGAAGAAVLPGRAVAVARRLRRARGAAAGARARARERPLHDASRAARAAQRAPESTASPA